MEKLSQLIKGKDLIVAPVALNPIMARMAAQAGFKAVYLSGGSLGWIKCVTEANLTLPEMAEVAVDMRAVCKLPIVLDAGGGWGDPMHVTRTIALSEAAGFAAIEIEDQLLPRRVEHHVGIEHLVPTEFMVEKVKAALAARSDPDFMIVARTNARRLHGLDEALRRGEAFVRAGADVVFIESPESVEEMRRIGETFRGVPLVANMVEGGRTPVLSAAELEAIGYRIAIFPALGFLAAGEALQRAYQHLRQTGSSIGGAVPLHDFQAFGAMMGFGDIAAFDRRWRD